MKLLATLLVLFLTFGCVEKKTASLEELSNTIELFNEAYIKGDTLTLSNMITENYVHTNSSWKSFGKQKWLTYMGSRREKIEAGVLEVLDYKMDEYAVELFENTALVTARISSRGIENGTNFEKSFRITNLWIYDGRQWLRAGFHDSIITN